MALGWSAAINPILNPTLYLNITKATFNKKKICIADYLQKTFHLSVEMKMWIFTQSRLLFIGQVSCKHGWVCDKNGKWTRTSHFHAWYISKHSDWNKIEETRKATEAFGCTAKTVSHLVERKQALNARCYDFREDTGNVKFVANWYEQSMHHKFYYLWSLIPPFSIPRLNKKKGNQRLQTLARTYFGWCLCTDVT